MAQTMGQFLTLAERDLRKIHNEDQTPYEAQYSKIFNVSSMDKLYVRDAKMAGFGPMSEIAEGGDVQFDQALAPVTRRYDYVKRGSGYQITDKLWKNDEYGQVMKFEGALRRACDDDIEQFCFNILNNATTTGVTGFDSLALASTAHTRLDGGAVIANRPSTLTPLSLASLKDARVAFKKFKDDRGRPYRSNPKQLIVSIDLENTAEEILGSPDRPDTANRAVNVVKGAVSWMSSPYITSTTFSALVGDKHDINILFRMRPKADSNVLWKSDTIERKITYEIARGFGEWRGFYLLNT
jgi:hypothetical protein